MESRAESSETPRNKCAACFKQFSKIAHLVEHMRTSYHSVHEPTCGICYKHCRSFDSLREHLTGKLPKQECKDVFVNQGCTFCVNVFDSPNARQVHQEHCQLSGIGSGLVSRFSNLGIHDNLTIGDGETTGNQVVALGCIMIGGGPDGALDICVRICLIDEEQENIIFHSYVKPSLPVTSYRSESTGIREENLRDALPKKEVQTKIQEFLHNGEPPWQVRQRPGRARILVGHDLEHDLNSLHLVYPQYMMRDTSKYPPFLKTTKQSNSLKYLTQTYLGYEIQKTGQVLDPYEDCVASMRLYKKMRSEEHKNEDHPSPSDPENRYNFASTRQTALEKMTPEQLLEISRSDYYCWCLDSKTGRNGESQT